MNTATSKQIELLELAKSDFERYQGLPFPVYITDAQTGTFLEFNDAAADFFGLDKSQKGFAGIKKYYRNEQKDRPYIMRCLSRALSQATETGKECWESNYTLEFNINGTFKSLKLYAKPYGNRQNDLLGSISLTFAVAEIDKFNQLEDRMPTGIFEVGLEQLVTYTNKSFKELLKISNQDEKIHAKEFFDDEVDFDKLLAALASGTEEKETGPVVLKKSDGNKLLANLIVVPQYNADGKLIKSRGILRDLTNSEIVSKAPIGIYFVMRVNGEDKIVKANKEFAKIHEFENENACIGYKIKDLHISPDSYEELLEKLKQNNQKGDALGNHPLEVQTIKGNRRHIRTNIINYIKTDTDEVIGRVGVVLDVTQDLDRLLESWKHDFAGFLHSYSNMLISMRDTINSIITGHGTDVFSERRVDIKRAGKTMESYLKRLKPDWEYVKAELHKKNIILSSNKIEKALTLLYKKDNEKFREKAVWARQIAVMIRNEVNIQLKGLPVHKETPKLLLKDISEILRYARLISLSLIVEDIPEILTDIDNFKSVLADSGDIPQISMVKVSIVDILSDVLKSLTEFAQSKRVQIEQHFSRHDNVFINGNTRYLYSAFYNIIHNAIKYSRSDDEFGKRWVDVFVTETPNTIEIQTVNLGVPIRKAELAKGLIKQFGFRGADSTQDGRKGSGIGLWHANKIIGQHNGTIDITSISTDKYRDEEDYKKWFKTTVTVTIKKQ